MRGSELGAAVGFVAGPVAAAVFALIEGACRDRPVVLIVDDVAWVDRASCEVVLFLARRSDLGGFAVLLATQAVPPRFVGCE